MCSLAKLAGEKVLEPNENCNYAGPGSSDDFHSTGRIGMGCPSRLGLYEAQGATWGQIERQLPDDDICPGAFEYGTMLRDPIALMLSMLNHVEYFSIGKAFLGRLRKALKAGTTGPYQQSEGLWKLFDNYQTRVLANAMDVPGGQINATHLELARARLARFRVAARLEDLGPEHPLFESLGWPDEARRQVAGRRKNPSMRIYKFNNKERSWLEDINRHDLALYAGLAPK